jgi:Protein of unknown function (DUF1064)
MSETVSVEEYRKLLKKQANTRGNERVVIDGYAFDSVNESRRYAELLLLERANVISGMAVHPRYELQAAFSDSAGERHRAIHYEADFSYSMGGATIVEDVKGHRTEVFKLKEKLFRFRYPSIDFRVLDIHER